MTEEHHKHFSKRELGIAQAMVEDFAEHRIPRLLSIEAEMMEGKRLSDLDLIFLKDCLEMSKQGPEFAERHSEYKALISKVAALYHHITALALKNEQSE
ncbi:MAG: hypothetical protein AAGJ37_02030 [Pseudomonadota bacterium]